MANLTRLFLILSVVVLMKANASAQEIHPDAIPAQGPPMVIPVPQGPAAGGCSSCNTKYSPGTACHRGSCLHQIKEWICYQPPRCRCVDCCCKPTCCCIPRLYTYFLTEHPGCAGCSGCGGGYGHPAPTAPPVVTQAAPQQDANSQDDQE